MFKELDPLLHSQLRLAIMSILLSVEEAEFVYKCDDFYHPEDEGGLLWNDPDVGIEWPISADMNILLSDKDQKNPLLRDFV